jgi:tetratricopeptide (TPR) repeat protein
MVEKPHIIQVAVGNYIAQAVNGTAVINVYQSGTGAPTAPAQPLERAGAWSNIPDLSGKMASYLTAFNALQEVDEYEYAKLIYWKILYFTGYRELWDDRLLLSKNLYKLSIRNNDFITAGLILSRGVSYAYLSQQKFLQARAALKSAWRYFSDSGYPAGKASCWDYMADIYAEQGRYKESLLCYEESIKNASGLERDQVRLKRLFQEIKNDTQASQSKVIALRMVAEDFYQLRDYREGLVKMELARTLFQLGDRVESQFYAEDAYQFFDGKSFMPRNRIKAEHILKQFKQQEA